MNITVSMGDYYLSINLKCPHMFRWSFELGEDGYPEVTFSYKFLYLHICPF